MPIVNSRPSVSAQHVALLRARLARPHAPDGDLLGEARLHASLAAGGVRFERFLAARTAFFDSELLHALDAGITQVVIVGAGYDERALRFRSPGVRFVEIDLPATQADKVHRLRSLDIDTGHIDFAAADLATDAVSDVLPRTSYDPLLSAVFLCEGVLLYLPYGAVAGLLAGLRSVSAARGRLLVSFATGAPGAQPAPAPGRPNASGEVRQSFYTPARAAEVLRGCGWQPARIDHPDRTRSAETDVALFVRAVPGS